MSIIYHMADKDEWDAAKKAGTYQGSPNDIKDGFIHFSTKETVVQSAAKHRAGEKNLLLLGFDSGIAGDDLKWEEARGGALFPHLYCALNPDWVTIETPLPLDEDGLHIFPELN